MNTNIFDPSTSKPVSLSSFDIPGQGTQEEADRPEEPADTEEDQLFRHMFSSDIQHPMPRPHRPSPAARFSLNNTPFRG